MKKTTSDFPCENKAFINESAKTPDSTNIEPKEPKAQTKATARYQNKVGLVSKSYKLKAEDVERFAKACEASGKAQSAVLTGLMAAFAATEAETATCWLCRLRAKLRRAKKE